MSERKLTPRLVIVPVVLLAYVSVMVFALAKAHPLSPAKPTVSGAPVVLGDVYRGEIAFQDACAGCHGAGGTGGGVGPTLAGRGLDLSAVKAQIETGSGAMPGNLVAGDRLADVLAYLAQITEK